MTKTRKPYQTQPTTPLAELSTEELADELLVRGYDVKKIPRSHQELIEQSTLWFMRLNLAEANDVMKQFHAQMDIKLQDESFRQSELAEAERKRKKELDAAAKAIEDAEARKLEDERKLKISKSIKDIIDAGGLDLQFHRSLTPWQREYVEMVENMRTPYGLLQPH